MKNKVYDAVMGLAVGDALGVPVEFKARDTFHVTYMEGFGTHDQPAGTWSDDTSMTLATMDSIVKCGRIDPEDIMKNFVKWFKYAEFTATGSVFDIGGTTKRAICGFINRGSICDSGYRAKQDRNGSLMRILPLAFFPSSMKDINDVSDITHPNGTAKRACRLYVGTAEQLLKGQTLSWCLGYSGIWTTEFERIARIDRLSRDDIRSTGNVVDTLEAALWCLCHTDSYKSCVLEAVNLGDDTDTIAAVAGGLAGILYGTGGENGIPLEWIGRLARKDYIADLCVKFQDACDKANTVC